MKRANVRIKSAFLSALVLAMVVWVNAGSLTPPAGPVAPTMKDLATVEPRTPISFIPLTISGPGSYYLTRDLTGTAGAHGIIIASSDVSLDFRGFTIRGIPGSLNGVHVSGARSRIRIENGNATGWGGDGINTLTSDKTQVIMFMSQGNGGSGVNTNGGTTVLYMSCNNNTGPGLSIGDKCICKDAECCGNGQDGIRTGSGCKIEDCVASSNGGNGINAGAGSIVTICDTQSNDANGISAAVGCSVTNCNVRSNTAHGIEAAGQCLVLENNATANATGIRVFSSSTGGTRVESNNAAFNTTFNFDIASPANFIVKNSSAGPGTGYNIVAGNDFGAIISLGGGGPFTVANTWANFDY
ncbi:MAG TPA: hypothetical protein VJZ71_09150 [Phycisphaerae bacterium]|nr:hypothetical protein [Phycisphaerae bacterium]